MSRRARTALALVTAAVATWLALPGTASAHAYLVKTVPAASVVLNAPPPNIQLTYDEAVEPRFAIISVTDVDAHQETTGPYTGLRQTRTRWWCRCGRICPKGGT